MTGVLICLVLATSCFLLASAKPSYKFAYGVHDPNTMDLKEQQEYKDDDNQLHGYYKTLDADGLMRTVTYRSHPSTGFEAHVDREPYLMPEPAISRNAGYENCDESPSAPVVIHPSLQLQETGQLPAEPLQSLTTRPGAWSMSMMHRIDPAAPPKRIASYRRAPIVLQHQDPNYIQYIAPIISHGYAANTRPNTGGFVETKTASAVIHPSPIATPIGSLQSQYSYGQPSAYYQSYGYPAERGATLQYYSTAAAAIPQYDSQFYSARSHQSYSPEYQHYSSEITPSYSSQTSQTFHGFGARYNSADELIADADPCEQ